MLKEFILRLSLKFKYIDFFKIGQDVINYIVKILYAYNNITSILSTSLSSPFIKEENLAVCIYHNLYNT